MTGTSASSSRRDALRLRHLARCEAPAVTREREAGFHFGDRRAWPRSRECAAARNPHFLARRQLSAGDQIVCECAVASEQTPGEGRDRFWDRSL